jgi:hypothetical protein
MIQVAQQSLQQKAAVAGDVEGQNILLHVLPKHRGQQFRVRVVVIACPSTLPYNPVFHPNSS